MPTFLVFCLLAGAPPADEARDRLRAAILVQTPDGEAPAIVDFQADLVISLFDPDQGGTPKTARVTEFYRRKGRHHQYHRILTRLPENRTTHLMTDGVRYALWEDGNPKVHDLLASPELKDDLDQLRTERARTQELIGIFFLAALDGPGVRWSLGAPRPQLKLPGGRSAEVVDLLREAPEDLRGITITLGRDDHRVYEVRLVLPGKDELFRFDWHELITRRDAEGRLQRILVPRRVEYFENGRRLMQASAEDADRIKFNTGLSDRIFSPPGS
jgi:hypothetical protein